MLNQVNKRAGRKYGSNANISKEYRKDGSVLNFGDFVSFTAPGAEQEVMLQTTGRPLGMFAFNSIQSEMGAETDGDSIEIVLFGMIDALNTSGAKLNKGAGIFVLNGALVASTTIGAYQVGYADEDIEVDEVGRVFLIPNFNTAVV